MAAFIISSMLIIKIDYLIDHLYPTNIFLSIKSYEYIKVAKLWKVFTVDFSRNYETFGYICFYRRTTCVMIVIQIASVRILHQFLIKFREWS